MVLEYISASFLYSLVKDIFRGRKQLLPEEILSIRSKWKKEVEEKLWEYRKSNFRTDVIIHDISRLDEYPDSNRKSSKRGISPWFRAGLMDTYNTGIMLGISWAALEEEINTGSWREIENNDSAKYCLVGKVPYESIVSIEWNGDDYYNKPHIFCRFDQIKRQPYEQIVYCDSIDISHMPDIPTYLHYREVVDYDDVKHIKR